MLSDADFFVIETGENRLDYQVVFGNEKPVYIEIGSGKGEFISTYPQHFPDYNFIGFEVRHKRIVNCLKKLDPRQNPNVRLIERKVDETISKLLSPASIDGAFIQHPDPWPKKRHHRRRLIQQSFLDSLAEVLKKGAHLHVSTDHPEYAMWIAREFAINDYYDNLLEGPMQDKPPLDKHVETWFEREQARMGYKANHMLFRRNEKERT